MRRWSAVLWHASFSVIAAALYFFFVLPRWLELIGETSTTLGTALRIVTGSLIGLAALPVLLTLLRTRRPEYGTPQLALSLRVASIALHVLAGALIVGTAISEIWISLDTAGQWLFGIYGAAAAIALLGIAAFYLAFVAERTPPPPKPLKTKRAKGRRGRRKNDEDKAEETEETEEPGAEAVEEKPDEQKADEASSDEEASGGDAPAEVTVSAEPTSKPESDAAQADTEETADGKPGDRSPTGKTTARRRRRSRGRVAVED